MAWNELVGRTTRVLSNNAPAILTGFAVAGTVMTAYLTGKASFKAVDVLRKEQIERNMQRKDGYGEILTPRDKFQAVWRLYIPPAASGLATVVFIIAAHRVADRRAAALALAYAISEKAIDQYKDKVVERLGDRKEQALRDELAQDYVDRHPTPEDLVLLEDGRSVLCCDLFTGRYFMSDMESIRRAQNDVNHQVNTDFHASLTDFYERIGLPGTSMSDDFGWNADRLMNIDFSHTLTPSGKPCLTINFRVMPIRGYHRLQ